MKNAKTSVGKLKKKCDDLFSKIVRSRGVCEKCGSTTGLQCAHVISRKHLQTRWDLGNALCLCLRCHIFWNHKEPMEFARWFDEKYGTYDALKKLTLRTEKIDYEKLLEDLKGIYDQSSKL